MADDRLGHLEAEVASLRAALMEARGVRAETMEAQRRCPGCGCRVLFHVEHVPDRNEGGWPGVTNLSLMLDRSLPAELEVYVCARCGLVEWYVKRPADLRPDGQRIALLGAEPEGPFR